ncbi:MAG: NVEALA domain-containing protein [Tannerellaceae bacterium]|jgi:hypothetical protein|nr:NVEALA domain-containing protein [Tannerellaceae bacterium]
MKQLLKLCIVIIGAAFLVILSKKSRDYEWNDLVYNNVEALASGEGSWNMCAGYGSIDCGGYKVKYKISGFSIGL